MRLLATVNLRRTYLVPNVFFPAVLLPATIFAGLYLYPFIDKLIEPDLSHRPHHVSRHW